MATEKVAVVKLEKEKEEEEEVDDEKKKHSSCCEKDISKKKKRKKKKYLLVRYSELPEYMKENEYILGHYRSEWPISRAFLSIFSWHNETINVWTHLIGFFIFLGLTLVHLRDVPEVAAFLSHFSWYVSRTAENVSVHQANLSRGTTSSLANKDSSTPLSAISNLSNPSNAHNSIANVPRWPFYVFMAGSMFCLLTSSLCHLLCCHSRRLNLFLARLDFVGIAIMIVASFFPPIYYIFLCQPLYQVLYLAIISAFGLAAAVILLSPHLASGAYRSFRAMLFAAMGLSGIVPAVHATVTNWENPRRPWTLACESAMAVSYLTGTMFYVSRVPEKWKPGAFDIAGHSHQIFHVFVVAGALAHYAAAIVFLEFRDMVGCGEIM